MFSYYDEGPVDNAIASWRAGSLGFYCDVLVRPYPRDNHEGRHNGRAVLSPELRTHYHDKGSRHPLTNRQNSKAVHDHGALQTYHSGRRIPLDRQTPPPGHSICPPDIDLVPGSQSFLGPPLNPLPLRPVTNLSNASGPQDLPALYHMTPLHGQARPFFMPIGLGQHQDYTHTDNGTHAHGHRPSQDDSVKPRNLSYQKKTPPKCAR